MARADPRRHARLARYAGCVAADVAIVEPPHLPTRDRTLDGSRLSLHRLVARAIRVPASRRRSFAEHFDRLLQQHGVRDKERARSSRAEGGKTRLRKPREPRPTTGRRTGIGWRYGVAGWADSGLTG